MKPIICSFPSELIENPDAHTLRVIEERFCKELGYAGHQRISAIHHDTDNVHIHVPINMIHPKTLTLHDPIRDYKKRSKLCAILEHELGLAQDNHQRSQTRGNDVTANVRSGLIPGMASATCPRIHRRDELGGVSRDR
ncbi:MAG: relaxase/mobilization nuclease domain-containing protein [Verrucomicrobia bacterium]|nr:relaxase/mobilization nuclease domain-containing protein [Verrucomicrobiota bacterium]